MWGKIADIQRGYDIVKTEFIQRSPLYKLSLDRRHGVFSPLKFITDPWSGSAFVGKSILDGKLIVENSESKIDIINLISKNNGISNQENDYVNSFSWIRDLQAIGGNNSRKYARKSISAFIDKYRSTKNFWLRSPAWNNVTIGERVVNWMFSYSFFASGSTDNFQKEVLSSINEQFSHLMKTYKAEFNPYARLLALKAIFFCLCSLKSSQARNIKKILKEIYKVINSSFDESGMFITRNPTDHFNMFRSLLEIRFMAKNSNIRVQSDVFDRLSKMAACVRFLRLGDGGISFHSGEKESGSRIIPTQHMIDTALSLVEISHYNEKSNKVRGFDRLSTKKATAVINTKICDVKSKFNSVKEPGINIFDFEASFGINKLINRADISILFNGFYVKADKKSDCFFSKSVVSNELCFDGEIQSRDNFLTFAMRRKLFININKPQIRGTDFTYIFGNCQTLFRFVLNKKSEIEQIGKKKILITINKREFLFSVNDSSSVPEIIIKDSPYPTIEIKLIGETKKESMFDWSMEEVES